LPAFHPPPSAQHPKVPGHPAIHRSDAEYRLLKAATVLSAQSSDILPSYPDPAFGEHSLPFASLLLFFRTIWARRSESRRMPPALAAVLHLRSVSSILP